MDRIKCSQLIGVPLKITCWNLFLTSGPSHLKIFYKHFSNNTVQSVCYTVQYIGAAKSIGAALFAPILEHKKTVSTFSFRIIYFRMLRIRIFKKNSEKVLFWGPYFEY
jgi:hypothetical protein